MSETGTNSKPGATAESDEATSTRVDRFRAEIAEMGMKDPALARDRLWLRSSVAMMAVGVALTIIAFIAHRGVTPGLTTTDLEAGDYLVLALVGVAVTVAGGVLFLRYSFAEFARFWLARLIFEQRAQGDRVTEACKR